MISNVTLFNFDNIKLLMLKRTRSGNVIFTSSTTNKDNRCFQITFGPSKHLSVVWKRLQSGLQSSAESRALGWAHFRVCSPLCRTSTSNAVKAELLKSSKSQITPGNRLFILLPSGKNFQSMMAKTERLRISFFPQVIRLLNSNSVS